MRLFIAIDLDELDDYFKSLQKQLPENAKLSLVKSFHLTLKFLGDVQPYLINRIIEDLKNVEFNAFSFDLGSIGVFPTENYIRVVWIGITPENRVLELQGKTEVALSNLFNKEKDFKAHITLARVKYLKDKKSFLEQIKKIKVENKRAEIKKFKLKKSILDFRGVHYEDLTVIESKAF